MATLPSKPRIHVISQARMTSTRLPGKIMRTAGGKTMLRHHIDRLRSEHLSIVIATTRNTEDDVVEAFASSEKIACYRGDEHDVLSRFYEANRQFPADILVRVTSDCPLIDAGLIQQGIDRYIELNDDRCYVSNCFPRSYARGFDFEVFSAFQLNEAHQHATSAYDREHVTPYIRAHYAERMHNISQEHDHSALRLTLDTPEDMQVLTNMIEQTQAAQMGYAEIERTLLDHPEWISINEHIEQKKS
jgi:spore coat polysaccharide biosynthesis protein SpsF